MAALHKNVIEWTAFCREFETNKFTDSALNTEIELYTKKYIFRDLMQDYTMFPNFTGVCLIIISFHFLSTNTLSIPNGPSTEPIKPENRIQICYIILKILKKKSVANNKKIGCWM